MSDLVQEAFDQWHTAHFTGILRGDPIFIPWFEQQEVPTVSKPTVESKVTITITLHDAGQQTGETYTWTREEAQAIRDELNRVLSGAPSSTRASGPTLNNYDR